MKRVYLSLGSNLGDRAGHLEAALEALPAAGVKIRRVSSFYRTEPVGFRPQPWFVNCAAEAETELMPLRLLETLKRVERALGRRRGTPQGPRAIDIDILLYENLVVRSARLTIPHPRLEERRFVLAPLCELAPHLRHPVTERTVAEMLAGARDSSQVIKIESRAPWKAGVSTPRLSSRKE